MICVDIPGIGELCLKAVVLDYNGTIARDGYLVQGVEEKLNQLARDIKVYILTADTFGKAASECKNINAELIILQQPIGAKEKERFIESLGPQNVVAIGNGTNDYLMLAKAVLGIVVLGHEGASGKTVRQADILVKDINEGLELLLKTKRLVATLRG